MRTRLLWIGGALAVLAVLVAVGVYVAYKSDLFRSAETERGETLPTNEADGPEPAAKPRPARAKASWPFFRYDALRNGVNPGARARPPFNVAWSKRVPRRGYLEAPAVVADGVLVYGSYGKRFGSDLFARDAKTGRRLWRKHYRNGANFAGSAGIFRGRVYITSHDGNIRCYGLRSGKIKFRKKIAAAESPPIGKGRYVYFGDGPRGGNGRFRAIDWRTGRTIWSYKASGTISSGAALTRSTLYFASYGGTVYALNRFTGKLRWKTTVRGPRNNLVPFYSTPALGRGRLVVGGTDGSVYALDARSGDEKWRYDGDGYVYGSAAIWHGRVFIGDFGGGFHALSLKSGRQLWKRKIGPIIGSATVMRGIVYISSLRPARTYAFYARSGGQVWRFNDGQFSPIIADGKQVWLTGKARVYRLAERESKAERRARLARRAKAKAKAKARKAKARQSKSKES
jgi:outer membrane protein assembly factor BamB